MPTHHHAIKPETMSRVAHVFGRLRDAFTAAPDRAWLSLDQLTILNDARLTAQVILRRLCEDKMLDRVTQGRVIRYRPTVGGWALLDVVGEVPTEELRARYLGSKLAPRKQGTCGLCGDQIVERRKDSTICWGCEQEAKRKETGHDWWPRTAAYLVRLTDGRRQQEIERVRSVQDTKRAQKELAKRGMTGSFAIAPLPSLSPSATATAPTAPPQQASAREAVPATTRPSALTEEVARLAARVNALEDKLARVSAGLAQVSKVPRSVNITNGNGYPKPPSSLQLKALQLRALADEVIADTLAKGGAQ